MKLLMLGDIVGRPGKHACSQIVPRMIRDQNLDLVIANAENASNGSGLTPTMFKKLLHYGIDGCTMGDHIYRRREILPLLESSDRIIRPANLPPEAVGKQLMICKGRNGEKLAVISVLGRVFMNTRSDCPFHAVDRVMQQIPPDVKCILVDMHAETTSEKVAMGWYLDGRVSAVVGTHTHIPTADERVLPRGTAYITDLGMTGPYDSVLGRMKDRVVKSLVTGMPFPYDMAEHDARLSGVIIEIDAATGKAFSIERVCVLDDGPADADNGD